MNMYLNALKQSQDRLRKSIEMYDKLTETQYQIEKLITETMQTLDIVIADLEADAKQMDAEYDKREMETRGAI